MNRKSLLRLHFFLLAGCIGLASAAIAQTPYGFRFIPTRETPSNVLYDSFHQRFYVTVPGENSVYVVNESDGTVAQKISVPSAFGLDLSLDGTHLFVTSSTQTLGAGAVQGYFIVDTTTLHVVDLVQPTVTGPSLTNPSLPAAYPPNTPRFIAALSNGNVAYTAEYTGVTGGAIFENDLATGISTRLADVGFYDGSISKSLDGSGFVAVSGDSAGDSIAVFDTASNSFTARAYLTTTNSADVIMSPDGTQILAGGQLLLDRNLNQLADLSTSQATSNFAGPSRGSTFSNDGSRIYVVSTLATTAQTTGAGTVSYTNPVIIVYNSSTHQQLGFIPLPGNLGGNTVQSIAIGNSGKAILPAAAGFLELNVTNPQPNLPAAASQSLTSLSPDAGTPTGPVATTVNGSGFAAGATVFFGQSQATATVASAGVINVQPPSSAPGPVAVTVGLPNGWAVLTPNAYSYGPVITSQDVTAGDSNGGTIVTLTGYGFDVTSGFPQIAVGGRSANVTGFGKTFFPETVTFTTPAGAIGPADIQLTSAYGNTTVKSGLQYLKQQLIPSIQPFQMIVDNARNQLYIADSVSGNVLDVDGTTLAVKTLFSSSTSPATGIAMTPDGSELLVASYSACTLDLIDLTTGNHLKTIVPVPGNDNAGTWLPNDVVATARGTAILSFAPGDGSTRGALYEVSLTTGVTVPAQVGYQTMLSVDPFMLLAASADGTRVYIAPAGFLGFDGGGLDLWQATGDSSVKEITFTGGIYQLATTDTGDRLLGDSYTYDTLLRQLTTSAPNSTVVAGRSLVNGEKLHSSGSLAYVPTTKGIEIFDVHHGATVLSIGASTGSLNTYDNLAINHAGTRLYLALQNGIGVFDLSNAPLSIGSLTPAQGSASGGTTVNLRGSGFVQGTSVTIDGNPSTVQFVDSTQLTLTTPAVSAAKDIVAVTNPDGTTYSLEAAFDASAVAVPAPPTLTSVNPSYVTAYSSGTGFLINGSGLTPASVVSLNGIAVDTQYINANQLTANFYNLPGPGQDSVTVTNPPNQTPSNPVYITTYVDGAYLNSVTPSSTSAGSGDFNLTVFGNTTMSPTDIVLWNGSPRPTTYLSNSYLIARISATDVETVGTATVTVSAPLAQAAKISNPVTFTITPSIAAATLAPLSATFNAILLGDSSTSTLTVSSTGELPLSMIGFTLSDTTDFSQTNNCPSTLAPGQSCTVKVTFAPSSSFVLGSLMPPPTLTLVSNAARAPTPVPLNTSVGDLRFDGAPFTASVVAGRSYDLMISVDVYGPVPSGTTQIACSSGLPQGATCSFTPSALPLKSSATFNLTISTSAGSRASLNPMNSHRSGETFTVVFALCVWGLRRRRVIRTLFLALIASSLIIGISACSSGSASDGSTSVTGGTPAGSYSVTLTVTSGVVVKTTTVALTVTSS